MTKTLHAATYAIGVAPILVGVIGLSLLPPAASAQQAPGPDSDLGAVCIEELAATDPRGDVVGFRIPLPVPDGHEALDILAVSLTNDTAGLIFKGTLAADPRDEPNFAYYYWMSFQVSRPGSPPTYPDDYPTWVFMATYEYNRVRSFSSSTPGPPALDVTWDGERFSFTVPWAVLWDIYGDDGSARFGSPYIYSSGPYTRADVLLDEFLGGYRQATAWYDVAFVQRGFVPLPACKVVLAETAGADAAGPARAGPTGPARTDPTEPARTPGLSALSVVAAVAFAIRRQGNFLYNQ